MASLKFFSLPNGFITLSKVVATYHLLFKTCCLLLNVKKWLSPSLTMQLGSPFLLLSICNLLELFVRFKNLLIEQTSKMFMLKKLEQKVGTTSLGVVKLGIVMDLMNCDS